MPRVLRHTPRWLERPAPGYKLFNTAEGETLANGTTKQYKNGALRTLVHRGTEVFVAVGNQLRWSDLVLLREQDYHRNQSSSRGEDHQGSAPNTEWEAYRVLKVPVYKEIRQLVISPQQDYLAILTSHTVHVALLPDPSLLNAEDTGPLKLKTWQVGPTAHVLERAPVASALWHPLADGPCLVTITEDAIVRLWELNRDNRWSFDNPALPLDLRKLANGSSVTQDFSPSKYGTSTGFSPDQFDMEVVAACFGGMGSVDEAGWSPLTLWIAMRNGDIYALCPFLPSKWLMDRKQLFHLAATVDSTSLDHGDEPTQSGSETPIQQANWAADVLEQQQQQESEGHDSSYCRLALPQNPAPIPALQGPYHFEPDADQVFDVTDIFAIAPKLDNENDVPYEPDDGGKAHLAPVAAICLATSDGSVHICLDIEETQARWITSRSSYSGDDNDDGPLPELLLIESVRVCGQQQRATWPTFSPQADSRFATYITHNRGVSYISPLSSLDKLADEAEGPADPSTAFRLRLLAQAGETQIQPFIQFPATAPASGDGPPACFHLCDSDLGDLLLTTVKGQPHAVTLDFSDLELLFEGEELEYGSDEEFNALHPEETRPSFTAPPELYAETTLPLFAEDQKQKSGPARQVMEKEIRLAPATVTLMMEAHRLLGSESSKLQDAVSSLFQRCERMQDELRAQLERVGEMSGKIDAVLDDNADMPQGEGGVSNISIEKRMDNARSRNETLQDRYLQLKEKVGQLDRRPLNDKEHPWIREIADLGQIVIGEDTQGESNDQAQPRQRLAELQRIKDDLVRRSDELNDTSDAQEGQVSTRKHTPKMNQVNDMLERETALVDATATKLEQLKGLA